MIDKKKFISPKVPIKKKITSKKAMKCVVKKKVNAAKKKSKK